MQISIARLMSSCAAVLLLSAVGLSWWMSSQVNRLDELGHELSTLGEAQENAQELRYHTAQIQQFYTDASLTGEREAADEGQQHYRQALEKLTALEQRIPAFATELRALRGPIDQLDAQGLRMFQAYSTAGKAAGDEVMAAFDQSSAEVIHNFAALSEPLGQRYQRADAETEAVREALKRNTMLAWGVVLAVMMATLWVISRRVLPPIYRLTRSLNDLNTGSGDLSRTLRQDHDDEIGQVVEGFNRFVAGLRLQISTVAEVAHTLDHSSAQLVNDAQAAENSAEVLR